MASRRMTDRLVSVEWQKDGRVFFRPYSLTENGLRRADGLPEVLDSLDDAAATGNALSRALARSNARVLPSVNPRTDTTPSPFLEWVGKRTWGEYMRGVRAIKVATVHGDPPNTVELIADQNKGGRGGFIPIMSTETLITFEDVEKLGRAVYESLAQAT